MLALRHSSSQDYSLADARRQHHRRIRKQELTLIFKNKRSDLLRTDITNVERPLQQHALFPLQLQNYYQYLTYLLSNSPPLIQQPLPLALPPSPGFPPSLHKQQKQDSNVYFEKNGIVVFRSVLGRGSFSKVRLGRVEATREAVAVKEVEALEPNQQKCLRELSSQYIIRVIDIFSSASKSFIVLELCQHNLRDQLEACNFEIGKTLNYFEQLVGGMDVLQSRNIIHRDLKFQNILIREGKVKIADFGLAKFLQDELEVESRRCGTPYTMAPEVYFSSQKRRTPYTVKSDIWAIGIILHEMLYQQHPFKRSKDALLLNQRANVHRKFGVLDHLIDRCLVYKPAGRADWLEFKQIFRQYHQKRTMNEPFLLSHDENYVQYEQPISPKIQEERCFKRKKQFHQEQQSARHIKGARQEEKVRVPIIQIKKPSDETPNLRRNRIVAENKPAMLKKQKEMESRLIIPPDERIGQIRMNFCKPPPVVKPIICQTIAAILIMFLIVCTAL